MGYPYENSKMGAIAKEYALEHGITFEQACDKLGIITLEDPPKIRITPCPVTNKQCKYACVSCATFQFVCDIGIDNCDKT